jgi:hypothetical protein
VEDSKMAEFLAAYRRGETADMIQAKIRGKAE